MNVKEVIEELKKYDEDLQVSITFKSKSITYTNFKIEEGNFFSKCNEISKDKKNKFTVLQNNNAVIIKIED